jgi:hypothetical protein
LTIEKAKVHENPLSGLVLVVALGIQQRERCVRLRRLESKLA